MMGVGHLSAARAMMKCFEPNRQEALSDIESLKALVEQQNLIIQTLLVLLLEKKVIDEEEFNEWAKKMDELDGARDGKLSEDKSTSRCPECGRQNPVTSTACMDCGRELKPQYVQKP
jgi:hypothetical protein